MGLVAYDDVSASPASHLLDRKHRDDLAALVNSEVMGYLGISRTSRLERVFQQLMAAQAMLAGEN